MNKEIIDHIHNGILFSHRKNKSDKNKSDICDGMAGPQGHDKSDRER